MNFSRKKLIIVQVKKLLRNYFKTSSQIDGNWRKEETSSASRSVSENRMGWLCHREWKEKEGSIL